MRLTIPHRVADLIRCGNHTIDSLCLAIYGTATQDDRRAMHTHIHRAKMLAPIEVVSIHTGAKVAGVPRVEYRLEG